MIGWRTRLGDPQRRAVELAAEGRGAEAVAAAELGVARARRRVTGGSARDARLAAALHVHAHVLGEAGRSAECVPVAEEAVWLWRQVGGHEAALAESLGVLGNALARLARLARPDPADAALAEALALREGLPSVHDVAQSLSNRTGVLVGAARFEEALAASEQLLGLLESGGLDDPALAASALANRAVALRMGGRWAEALDAQHRSIEALRDLAARSPVERPSLATAVGNLAAMHLDCGRAEDALGPAAEAVELRDRLVSEQGEGRLPELALALHNLGAVLAELGRHGEAVDAATRCVDLRRTLHAHQPAAYEARLAGALSALASHLVGVGRADEAVIAALEAAERLEALHAQDPGPQAWPWAACLDSLAQALAAADRTAEAMLATEEAVDQARLVVRENPGLATGAVEVMLGAAGRYLWAERYDEARQAATEAVGLAEQLSVDEPGAYAAALHSARAALAAVPA